MREYNKLVRDRIPALIEAQGERPTTRRLSEEEYVACLREKLQEEVAEYLQDETVEELCDILEVIDALATAKGVSLAELLEQKGEKAARRGGFGDKVFLICVE